jgi:hypothetical protein
MAFELCLKTPQHRQSPIEKQVRFQETPNFINVVDYGSAGGLANENFLRYEEVMESDHVILQGGTVDNGWCADIVGGQDDPVRKALIADLEEKKLACQRLTAAKRHFALHSPNSVEDKTLVMRCNQRGKAIDMAAQALGDYDAFKRWRSAPAAERAAMDQGARERASRRNDRQAKKAARQVRLNGLFFVTQRLLTMPFGSRFVFVADCATHSLSPRLLKLYHLPRTPTTPFPSLRNCISQTAMTLIAADL